MIDIEAKLSSELGVELMRIIPFLLLPATERKRQGH